MAVAAEGIGQDDIGPGFDEAAVQVAHPFGMLEVPHFRRIARFQAHLEVIGAGGAIGQEPGALASASVKDGRDMEDLLGKEYKEVFI